MILECVFTPPPPLSSIKESSAKQQTLLHGLKNGVSAALLSRVPTHPWVSRLFREYLLSPQSLLPDEGLAGNMIMPNQFRQ